VITADGLQLARVAWPPKGRPRGTVLIVHGLGEHCERYVRLAADLTAEGWSVQSYDQRGHGESYQVAFNSIDMMLIHGLQGAVDEQSDRGRQGNRCEVG
jgi:alpha-beta hydrolase superfamily lysophospholipase